MKRGVLLVLALAVLASLGAGVRFAVHAHRESRDAEQAYQSLTALCSKGTPIPVVTGLDPLFKVLLRNPYGPPLLRKLGEVYPSVAFHEGRHAVFFLHFHQIHSDGTVDQSFSCSAVTPQGDLTTGAGFESAFLLKRVRVEGDQVLVDFEISKTLKNPINLEGTTFEAGTAYTTLLNARDLVDLSRGATEIFPGFYSRGRRR